MYDNWLLLWWAIHPKVHCTRARKNIDCFVWVPGNAFWPLAEMNIAFKITGLLFFISTTTTNDPQCSEYADFILKMECNSWTDSEYAICIYIQFPKSWSIYFVCLFVCNRGDTVQYHGSLRSRELGQASIIQVFLTPRQASTDGLTILATG